MQKKWLHLLLGVAAGVLAITTAQAEDYPVVAQLETAVYGQSQPSKELEIRLTTLEHCLMLRPTANASLADRVDTLQQAQWTAHPLTQSQGLGIQLSVWESQLFPSQAQTLSRLPLTKRLSHLEQRLYGFPFLTEPLVSRYQRLGKRFGLRTESTPSQVTWRQSYWYNPTQPF